ncbi:RNA methyltransferase [Paracrocinitomix mangrovi]|uniref:RNA methyltransferase n=1 Tax=Paracrocinitomix mangrovi TaxID=2862509 RepID=UPI001C8E8FFA|nr:RNA methyltransferase [Paracrocinitomix mangrovi]UKN02103.1 RNA methyltransferase [Paracrocinitomix mangrovi]
MKKHWDLKEEQFFGIGVYQPKTSHNIGTLWRTAYILGAQFIFIVDGKYQHQASDTMKTWSKIPLYKYDDFDHLYNSLPHSTQLVGVELYENSTPIRNFAHPYRAAYLLGAENNGLPDKVLNRCHQLVQLPGEHSLNVSVSGSIVMFDRLMKQEE